jgi:superfamily II DNA or RNA helicase
VSGGRGSTSSRKGVARTASSGEQPLIGLDAPAAARALELLEARDGGESPFAVRARTLREQGAFQSIVDLVRPVEPWERALKAIIDLGALHSRADTGAAGTAPERRLVWFLQYNERSGSCSIEPREQKRDARGQFSRGRPVALKRLFHESEALDYLTDEDRRVVATLNHDVRRAFGYPQELYYFDIGRALLALAGHPRVFWADRPDMKVEVLPAEPELVVTEGTKQVTIALEPAVDRDREFLFRKEGPDRLKVVKIGDPHRRIAAILGDQGIRVPKQAKDRVKEAIAAVAPLVNVQSDIGAATQLEEVGGASRPVMRIVPCGPGLRLEMLVTPFGDKGPAYRPGHGGGRVIAEIEGRRLQARRDLKQERRRADALVSACPTLERIGALEDVWTIEDPEDSLEALLELHARGDAVRLEWPQGQNLRVDREASLEQLRLRIRGDQDWFGVTGGLTLDDGRVLDMQALLGLIEQSPGRFIPLGEGRFLALTRELRRRLEDLDALTAPHGKGVRFHRLAAGAIEEVIEGVGSVETDEAWREQLERVKQAGSIQPELPSTFQAELRPYQLEGFRWLARLAHWGVGACLADDMGLGKTVQTLALLLRHAPEGPALVVAPTSVCMNWIDEARRFAPTLNPIYFGPGDRTKVIEGLGPFDLLVCSYGLMHTEIEHLERVAWRSIVLDEAQAIKNVATRRSQAALRLGGAFRMACTGTPIENHLGELWNLFRFLNPGLLGSLEQFNARFAGPIEKQQDRAARARLKRMLQPFILRRTKNEVLQELPPRTEILIQVEPGEEEAALYEALRRRAVETLEHAEGPPGQRQLRILAEIMKLRRAASNPRLVAPELSIRSSKLSELEEILGELIDNRHKALIFSQFVDHLAILRDALDRWGVVYQYLDGSTPPFERRKRVEAFQAGKGDVFLISLKAGGLGLNLTAADYVIHMDPWWNPAVEDQASDRAHRIGQSRPVTIYRLVAKGTIEEKILALHHRKRDLADSLLEGADVSGRLTEEELLALLRG